MRRKQFITLFSALLFIIIFGIRTTEATPPIPPDYAQYALDLLTIECQNLTDLSKIPNLESSGGSEKESSRLQSTIQNIDYLLMGQFPQVIHTLQSAQRSFATSMQSTEQAATTCWTARSDLYSKYAQYPEIKSTFAPITNLESCQRAGYFDNDGFCFMNGNMVFDPNTNLIGFYNANCCDANGCYNTSCWYCLYGNDENGCYSPF